MVSAELREGEANAGGTAGDEGCGARAENGVGGHGGGWEGVLSDVSFGRELQRILEVGM